MDLRIRRRLEAGRQSESFIYIYILTNEIQLNLSVYLELG